MIAHKPWQFFIIRFTADDGKHTVSAGASCQQEAVELIKDMYTNVRALRVFPRVYEEKL